MVDMSKYSPQDLEELKRVTMMEQEKRGATFSAPTMFRQEDSDNLIKYQLDIREELERIEHLLRKHVPKIDENGNLTYAEPTEENRIFNEVGVNEILNLLAWYLNKNIILSNFDETQINQRCHQLLIFLSDFIHNNYQKFGLDDGEKIKHYPLIVMNIINTIEASYNRALGGGERESLRTARQVTQQEPLSSSMNPYGYGMMQKPSKSILKPWTWGR